MARPAGATLTTLSNSSPGWGNKCCITQTRFGIEIRDWGKAGSHTVTAAHTAAWRNCENEKETEGLQQPKASTPQFFLELETRLY